MSPSARPVAADGDGRDATDKTLTAGVACDDAGCIGHLKDGRLVSYVKSIAAFAEDCRHAAVVVSARAAQRPCEARLIDRNVWHVRGAVALRLSGDSFVESSARPPGYDRPWAPAAHPPAGPPASVRDATPRPEDLEPGD